MNLRQNKIKGILLPIGIFVVINVLASLAFKRFDLTHNQRYTLSAPSLEIIHNAKEPIYIQVFLKGDFPSNFKRLATETRYLLEELSVHNRNLKFEFIDPLKESGQDPEIIGEEFFQAGMPPRRLNVRESGKNSETLIFPWALAIQNQEQVRIPLLKANPEDTEEELVNNSVQRLEYAFVDALKRLTTEKTKKIAVLRGNGELPDLNLAGFLQAVGNYYQTAPFTLDSVSANPIQTLKQLQGYDLIVEAKPTKPFTEEEKFVLDQYLMNGGKALWLVESVAAEKDSLFTQEHLRFLAYPRDLNLNDFFFKYGVRIRPSLVNDLHADNLILASGQGKDTRFETYPWYYAPLAAPEGRHPIVHNIGQVRFDFANPIDTLKNSIQKTILLQSSLATRLEGIPREIDLRKTIEEKPNFQTYRDGQQALAVLLEGRFTSVYKDRIKPFEFSEFKAESPETKMIVVSDGDVIKNQVKNGKPTSLEYDPNTGKTYGNEEFLLNAINYMLDDSGLLKVRSKKVEIGFLDTDKLVQERTFWQLFNIGLPLLVLVVCGLGFNFYRKRKYT